MAKSLNQRPCVPPRSSINERNDRHPSKFRWWIVSGLLLIALCPRCTLVSAQDVTTTSPAIAQHDSTSSSLREEEPEWRRTSQGWVRAADIRADVNLENVTDQANNVPHPLVIAGLLVLGTLFTLIAFSKDVDWN